MPRRLVCHALLAFCRLGLLFGAATPLAGQGCPSFDPPCQDDPPIIAITPMGGTYLGSAAITVTITDDWGLNPGSLQVTGATPGSVGWGYANTYASFDAGVALQPGVNTIVTVQICESWPGTQCVQEQATFTGAIPPTPPARAAPLISTAPHNGENRQIGACVAACFDNPISYSTVPYVSLDAARSVTLVYNLDRMLGTGLVTVDATENSTDRPVKMSLRIRRPDGTYHAFYANGNPTEIFFATGATTTGRLSGWILPGGTGALALTAVVANHWSDGTRIEDSVPIRVLEVLAGGPFGAGWGIAGLEDLDCVGAQCDLLLTSGDGSVAYFTRITGTNNYQSPKGDFSTLSARSSSSDGNWFDRKWADSTWATYDVHGRMTAVTDRFGNRVSYTYNGNSAQLATITDPAGRVTQLVYDVAGMLDYIQDPGGRVTQVTVNAGGDLVEVYDPDGVRALEVGYTGWHVPLYSVNRVGARTDYGYSMTKLAGLTLPTITVNGQSVRPYVRLMSLEEQLVNTDPALGTSSAPAPWRSPGLRIKLYAPNGDSTLYLVDRFGAAIETSFRDPQGKWQVQRADRNEHGLVYYESNLAGGGTSLTWDGPRLMSVTDAGSGSVTSYTYQAAYSLPQTITGDGILLATNYYGPLGRLDSTKTGTSVSRYTHDSRGRVLTARDPDQNLTTIAYHPAGSLNTHTVTAPGGSGFTGTSTFVYDAHGRPQTATDPTSRTVTFAYDLINRVTSATGPLSVQVQYGYDDVNRTYTVTDAKNQVYRTRLNALGWVDSLTDPRGGVERYTYDQLGNVLTYTNRRNQQVTFAYDARNRLLTRLADGQTTTFAYDDDFRWSSASNAESTDTLNLDATGRLIDAVTWRNGVRHVVHQGYDQSVPTEVRLDGPPGGYRASNQGYDGLLRLNRLWDFGGKQTEITYTSRHQRYQVTLPTAAAPANRLVRTNSYSQSGTQTIIGYNWPWVDSLLGRVILRDTLDRATQVTHGSVGNRLQRNLTYDVLGRLKWYRDTHNWFEQGQLICPDPMNLETCYYEQIPHSDILREQTLVYDSVGNRRDLGAVIENGNRLTAFNGYTLQYDADGNLVSKTKSGFTQALTWNALGQLTQVVTNGVTTTLGYDGFGRRARKTSGGITTRYLWDGDNLIAELDANGTRLREYSYYPGVDQPHAVRRVSDGARFYYATDFTGHVIGLVNTNDVVVNLYDYTPFGEAITTQEQVAQPFRFAGREFDVETGLYFNRARYYDPQLGRFISEDPIGLDGGINPFVYASNDPTNRIDPFGLDDCPPGQVEAFVGDFPDGRGGSYKMWECVRVGGGGGTTYTVQEIVVHADPNEWGTRPDLALIFRTSADLGNATGGDLALGFFAFTIPLPGKQATAVKRILSAKTLARMPADAFHRFPAMIDKWVFQGTRTVVSPNYVLYTQRGFINGVAGVFEIGVRPSASGGVEVIVHHFFRPL